MMMFIFAIFLLVSPTLGLVETLFQAENNCYSGCHSNYADHVVKFDACRNGCDFKLQNENCPQQCRLLSINEQIQASCVVGCSMNRLIQKQKPVNVTPNNRQKLFLIFHLRRPGLLPFSRDNTQQVINDVVKQIKEQSKSQELNNLANLIQNISLINDANASESKHLIILKGDKHEQLEDLMKGIRSKWNQLIHKESKFSIWILCSLFLVLSIILCYMIISLCRHRNLSIRAQDLILENELLHPNTPVKIKLENI